MTLGGSRCHFAERLVQEKHETRLRFDWSGLDTNDNPTQTLDCHSRCTRSRRAWLSAFAMLVSLGGCEAQVKGHVAANLNVGNDRGVLLSVITQLLPFIGYPRTLNALQVIDEVTPA
jgi:hypothetical protein